ncbi:Eco57I restriction-modification methylase domain-containing protein [Arenimonas fontis]|uniref:Eco57I restriction-modification methylase domain-containing protein n=1 Tax=Arenimonas fontis TaxID=2608255 RepID=UPI001FEA1334|nr:Eco57I restriction-modification methylase domain-containing protein [Arenimonas fontis]
MSESAVDQRLRQASFPGMCPIEDALELLSNAGIDERGAVFTRREVVDFILDLVGYTPDRPLHEERLLEPSFGHGEFLLAAIERLVAAWQTHAPRVSAVSLANCIRAVELHRASFEETRGRIMASLQRHAVPVHEAKQLVQAWLIQGDFLLVPLSGTFDYVVGNPPYVRQELIPDALLAEYRTRYRTIFDRADIYIPFIERSLSVLGEGGALGFICADRWMKNRYGGPLRQMVAERFHLKFYIDMHDTPAFHSEVIAYPAITVIVREKPGRTRIARRPIIEKSVLNSLAKILLASQAPNSNGPVKEIANITAGAQPWILDSSDQVKLVRRLERDFPAIEDAGCKVGIGVATGADDAFIGPFDELDVEDDRKLPLVMTKDILSGTVQWRGLGIVNPFAEDGSLVDLGKYPRLRRYLEARKDQLAKRHVAQKAPANWYRTIDRIYPELTWRPKLLIPDIKGKAHVVYEDGKLYPHHNLYFITSDEWDLHALQAVLLSGIARLFVATYSTRMRGGYLRFQAQYLRRIRLPRWADVPNVIKKELVTAARKGDTSACNSAVFRLYSLSKEECATLDGNGE